MKNYHSTSSQKIKDRYIEPIHFDEDQTYLIAFDLEAEQQRQFKLDRIEGVEVSGESITGQHRAMPIDLFGFTGAEWLPFSLQLSAIAYRLLIEEFPAARPFVTMVDAHYIFTAQVKDWRGLGRFVLGLPGEIKILEPTVFKTYLQAEIARFSF